MWHTLKTICLTLWQVKEAYLEFTKSFSSQVLLLTIFAVILQQIERQDTRWDHWFIAIAVPFGLFFLYAYLANIALFYKNAARAEVRRLCQQNRYAEARMHLRHIRNKHYLIAPLIILTLITLGSLVILVLAYQASLSLYQNLQTATHHA